MTLPSLYILDTVTFVKENPELFQRLADVVSRNRRDTTRLRLHSSNTALMHNSVFCMAPAVYNKIPNSIKSLNCNLFKKKMQQLLVERCYYHLSEFLTDTF